MADNIIELKVPPRLPNLLPAEYGNFRYFVADLVSRFTFFAYGSDNGGLSTHTQLVVASLSHTQVADRLSSMVIHQAGLLLESLATTTKIGLDALISNRAHGSTRFLYALWQAVQQANGNQAVANAKFNPQTLQLPNLNSNDLPDLTNLLYEEFVDFVKSRINRYWDACEAAPLTRKGIEHVIRTMPEDQVPPPVVLHFAKVITPLAFKLSTPDLKSILRIIGNLCGYEATRLSEILAAGFTKTYSLKELFELYVLEIEYAPEPALDYSTKLRDIINAPPKSVSGSKAEPWDKVEPWEEAEAADLFAVPREEKSHTKIIDQLEADNCALRSERDYYAEAYNTLKQQSVKQAAQIRELQSRLNNPSAVNGTKPGLVGLNGFGLQILED